MFHLKTVSRVLSLVVSLAALVALYLLTGDAESSFYLFGALLFPLACIWFADELGSVSNVTLGFTRPVITETTPGLAVALGGWMFLIVLIAAKVWLCLKTQGI